MFRRRDAQLRPPPPPPSPPPSPPQHEADEATLHQLLLDMGMPADLASQLPACALSEPLRKLGATKIGHRQRILALMRQKAAAAAVAAAASEPSPPDLTEAAQTSPPSSSSSLSELHVPRRLFTFWHADPSTPKARASADEELVKCCFGLMKRQNPAWEFRVLTPACTDLPPPPVADATALTGAQLADWYRLCALALYGGVYLDATCITLQPLEAWVDLKSDAVQGFTLVSDLDTMESWAIAAPSGSAFLGRWRDEFGSALRMGTREYCSGLPSGVISAGLRPSLPYLTIHAAWRVARAAMPHDAPHRLLSPVEAGRPYRHLAEANWDSPESVRLLFAKSAEELASCSGPLIKLRGKERDSVQPLATYGRASALARALLSSTVPSTVVERMAFLRLGLDPDAR